MGAGASGGVTLKQARSDEKIADELFDKADGLYADLKRQLTSNTPTSAARKLRLRAQEPSALCLAGA